MYKLRNVQQLIKAFSQIQSPTLLYIHTDTGSNIYIHIYIYIYCLVMRSTLFAAQVIQWVDDTGSGHVEITSVSASEQETQEMLQEHRAFMENDATVSHTV